MSPATSRRPGLIRNDTVCGSISASPNCPPEPFENEQKYPGVKIGAREARILPRVLITATRRGSWACVSFPIPHFDEKAAKKWDPVRYYNDPKYYLSKDLVRPYRVGMSCAFCHVGPNPIKPPADPEQSEVGEPQLERWRAVLLDRSHLRLESGDRAASSFNSFIPRGRGRSIHR